MYLRTVIIIIQPFNILWILDEKHGIFLPDISVLSAFTVFLLHDLIATKSTTYFANVWWKQILISQSVACKHTNKNAREVHYYICLFIWLWIWPSFIDWTKYNVVGIKNIYAHEGNEIMTFELDWPQKVDQIKISSLQSYLAVSPFLLFWDNRL